MSEKYKQVRMNIANQFRHYLETWQAITGKSQNDSLG